MDREAVNSTASKNLTFKECTAEEFHKTIENLKDKIFSENSLSLWPKDFLSQLEQERLKVLNQNYNQNYELYLILYQNDQIIGWSFGLQDSKESFLMANSAVLPEFRRQGFYSLILKKVLEVLVEKGFQRIWSSHRMTNNAVIIPKLKQGFVIMGLGLHELSGATVGLVYLPNEVRKKLMDFRTGVRPSKELSQLLKL